MTPPTRTHRKPAGRCKECGRGMYWEGETKTPGTVLRKGADTCASCAKRVRQYNTTPPVDDAPVFTNAQLRDWMDQMVIRRRAAGVPPEGVPMTPGETNAGAWELVS